MRIGDLVKITRASIGVPEGTLGLIISFHYPRDDSGEAMTEKIPLLQLIGTREILNAVGHRRRYLARDLEVIGGTI